MPEHTTAPVAAGRGVRGRAFALAARVAARLVSRDSRLAPLKRRIAARLRPAAQQPVIALVRAFERDIPQARFVQVGSNDGEQQDPLTAAIDRRRWRGVMVEPVPYVFARLRRRRGDQPGVHLANVAVAPETGTQTFYHLREATREERAQGILPDWYDALGSFDRETLVAHAPYMPDADLVSRIEAIEVPTTTFEELCHRGGLDGVDIVHIDTEGYDFEVIKLIDFERWRPQLLIYEHLHLGEDRGRAEQHLRERGYELASFEMDTCALDAARAGPRLRSRWRQLAA